MCDKLTAAPTPSGPVPLRGRRWRKSGVKLSTRRREGWEEGGFKI